MDMVFDGKVLQSGYSAGMSKKRISHMCESIPKFYNEVVRPLFSRHLAGLEPDLTLLYRLIDMTDVESDANAIKHKN
jgi:hypothetical protein